MLHEEPHRADPREKIVRMANQIGTFFELDAARGGRGG